VVHVPIGMVPPVPRVAIHRLFVARICNGRDAEGAVYAANNAANHAADQAAKRSCRLHADVSAMSDTVRDTLCLRRKRESK
jgi:hypothetical protein